MNSWVGCRRLALSRIRTRARRVLAWHASHYTTEMSGLGSKKQPTISMFFASSSNGQLKKCVTDEEKKVKSHAERAEVVVSPAIKRANSGRSKGGKWGKGSAKRARLQDHTEHTPAPSPSHNGSPVKRDLTPWTKTRLGAFSCDPGVEDEAGAAMAVEEGEAPGEAAPTNEKNIGDKLNAFKNTNGSSCSNNKQVAPPSAPSSSSIKPALLKPLPGMKLTPLEHQVADIKNKQPDVLLFVECGYKYRFFGNDAEIAAKELNIIAHLDHSFMTASIPTHRLHVHVRRLVAKGYKVGVVKQTETAALKAAGANKTAPFGRKLTALYTRSTLIGEDVTPGVGGAGLEDGDVLEGTTAMLLVLSEAKVPAGKDGAVLISIVAIQPSTGDIIYDTFEDSKTRTELCCRLDHLQPVEAVVSPATSELTTKTITSAATKNDDCIRIEHLDENKFDSEKSMTLIVDLLNGEDEKVNHISSLPTSVIGCVGATLQYLAEFKLDGIVKMAGSIQKYSSGHHHMRLSGATLRNLEVLANAVDGSSKGSLFWALDSTQTKFGSRLLRRWITQPLLDEGEIVERQDMVDEVIKSSVPVLVKLKEVLYKLPDFERAITTIFHKKCSPHEFWLAVQGLSRLHSELSKTEGNLENTITSPGLVKLLRDVLDGLANVEAYAANIHEASARESKKTTLLKDFSEYPNVISRQQEIAEVEKKLKDLIPDIARTLAVPAFKYTTVSGLEYLIEVPNSRLKAVPKNWSKISSTKAVGRFRSPEIERNFQRLQQLREQLQLDCHEAWVKVLADFSGHYHRHRQAVRSLAALDVLVGLAGIARTQGFCRPKLSAKGDGGAKLKIVQGRHPVVSQIQMQDKQYVANDTNMEVARERVMLVTGPNMGGKSCYMRQVALIALMAQMGSFVPADSVEMTILDAIYTRQVTNYCEIHQGNNFASETE
ncbi:DNA mismatch repair protein Msh3 [Chionoecetes opilio]|uniref:DNA mismatch repair protein MSH3 n=1 Tax=Chionoecetes opilio TaxID=41210 RepID=A0A8J4Y6Y4_CHIOP|nr:DNA mismatch repair protein Msh3 [Chionoecetes opilio]